MWPELLDNLRAEAAAAETQAERVRLAKRIGALYAARLEIPARRSRRTRRCSTRCRETVKPSRRCTTSARRAKISSLAAADILEPVLRAGSQFEKLVEVLEMRARVQNDAVDCAATLKAIAQVLDASLGRPSDAESVLLRAIVETPEDSALYGEIERLAAISGGYRRYADVLEERAATIFDAAVAQDLWRRLGHVAETELKDDRRAIGAYAKASEQAGDDAEILAALDRLYERTKDYRALANIIERQGRPPQ